MIELRHMPDGTIQRIERPDPEVQIEETETILNRIRALEEKVNGLADATESLKTVLAEKKVAP